MTTERWVRRVAKPVVFAASLVPLGLLVWWTATDQLSANPISDITLETGTWTLRFIVITLAISPLRRITGWHALTRFRRMLGLFAFFYGCLHFTIYLWLDQFFDVTGIIMDVAKRPFITAGFVAFVAMVPLALTSTAGMIRRLGGKRWQRLHRLVYLSGIAAVVHYWWLVKADVQRPQIYAAIVALLLGFRIVRALPLRRQRGPVPVRASSSIQ